MFGKRTSHSSHTTIIGRGARFTGTLELEGDAHIEGQCDGTIRAQTQLSIGAHGSVLGELSGSVVVVAGKIEGTVIAKETLHVLNTGSLQGDVFYGRLQVDSGGVIDGRTHQGAPPSLLMPSMAPEAAHEIAEGSHDESRVIDARPKLSSMPPPPAAKFGGAALPAPEALRSNAPGRR